MSRVTLDAVSFERLREAKQAVEVCAPDGRLLGHFIPVSPPSINEEELRRREQAGGGRRLSEILADLEKRS